MVEEISKIIRNSIDTFTGNLNIIIPYFMYYIIVLIITLISFFVGIILIFGSSLSSLENVSNPEQSAMIFLQMIGQHIYEIIVFLILFILIMLFVFSFFMAGAIGMASQAIETGRSRLSSMMESGKKNLINMYLTQILNVLLVIAGIVFLVPGAMRTDLNHLLSQETTGGNLLLGIGFLLARIYWIILSLLLAVSRYSLVIDNIGPIDSITSSVRFFKNNKTDVFIIWLIWFVIIEISSQLILSSPDIGIFIFGIVFGFILEPLFMVVWVRLYMTRTGKQVYVNDLLVHPNDLEKI